MAVNVTPTTNRAGATALPVKVRQVADRAGNLVRLHGLGWFVAVTCLAALALGLLDYWVRPRDPGIRLICAAAFWLVVAWALSRFIYPAYRYRCSELQAAGRIERWFPAVRDRLSHAVAFATQSPNDPLAGSPRLRQIVVAQTEAVAAPLEFTACLDNGPSRRAVTFALVVSGAIASLGWLDPGSVSLAGKRLLAPWGNHPWPRRHVLAFVDPPGSLAVGADFEVEVIDRTGRMPSDVEIHYWFSGDEPTAIMSQPMQPMGEKKMMHRLSGVARDLRYRATGGDDQDMAWRTLRVVTPPALTRLELTLIPPAYTGLPIRTTDGNLRALYGTRVAIRARLSKPISTAWLDTNSTHNGVPVPLAVDDDQLGFSLAAADESWLIRQSGSFGFRLIDAEGVNCEIGDRWSVDAVPDLPPTVSLSRPAADQPLTPRAEVRIEAIVKDDLAIRSVDIRYRRSGQEDLGEQSVPILSGPDQVAPDGELVARRLEEGVQQTIETMWDLSQLPSLQPGEWIDFRIVASDYHPQEGQSVARRLTIITEEELADRIGLRRDEILARIADIVRIERQVLARTSELEIQAREVGSLGQEDLDQLQGVELSQRQVQQQLGRREDGVATRIAELLAELENNRVDNPSVIQELAQLERTVAELNRTTLPRTQDYLVDAVKVAREILSRRAAQPDGEVEPALREQLQGLIASAGQGQRETIQGLEQALGRLAQWDSYRQLAREAGRIHRDQQDLHHQTQRWRQETLAKELRDLTDQERAGVRRLEEIQHDMAMRFDTLRGSMQATRDALSQDDPQAADRLAEALDLIQREGIAGSMRDVARHLGANRVGQAAERQADLLRQLDTLRDTLTRGRPLSRPDERRQLDERRSLLRQTLLDARARQLELADATRQTHLSRPMLDDAETAAWTAEVDALAAEQARLLGDTETLQSVLADLEAFLVALRDVVRRMSVAAEQLGRRDPGPETQESQQAAADRLRQLAELLEDPSPADAPPPEDSPGTDQPSAEPDQRDQRMLTAQLKLVLTMQEEVNQQTAVLHAQVAQQRLWTEPRTRTQRELAQRQGELADLLHRLAQPGDGPSPREKSPSPDTNLLDDLDQAIQSDGKGTTWP